MIKTYIETRYFDPASVPFYVEDVSGEENILSIVKSNNNAPTVTVEYSTDRQNWQTLGTTSTTALTYNIPANGRVYLRANATTWCAYASFTFRYNKILASKNHAVGGNIMSLLYKDNFAQQTTFPASSSYNYNSLFLQNDKLVSAGELLLPATTLTMDCYQNMFKQCTLLATAPDLPATTLATDCYSGMFDRCTALTTAPALPATNLANKCYQSMFNGCTAITTAPALPATTLASNCYNQMFNGCTSLTAAPELPATTLATNCYQNMFLNCSNLSSITVGATNWANQTNWVSGVAATGTFTKPSDTSIDVGVNGIPSGWTVINV